MPLTQITTTIRVPTLLFSKLPKTGTHHIIYGLIYNLLPDREKEDISQYIYAKYQPNF